MGTFEKFKTTWEEEIKKIENSVLDNRAASLIYGQFSMDRLILMSRVNKRNYTNTVSMELHLIESKLTRAVEIARSNFKLQNRSILVKTFEGIAELVRGVPKLKKLSED